MNQQDAAKAEKVSRRNTVRRIAFQLMKRNEFKTKPTGYFDHVAASFEFQIFRGGDHTISKHYTAMTPSQQAAADEVMEGLS